MKKLSLSLFTLLFFVQLHAQEIGKKVYPSNTETVKPMHKADFNNGNQCPERRQGGNTRMINGYQVFDGSLDGNRQVDPQIAVGGGYILHGTNSGLIKRQSIQKFLGLLVPILIFFQP